MKKSYKINEKDAKIIREEMRRTKKTSVYCRLEAVALLSEGKVPKEVSEITGYNPKYVQTLGLTYNEKGLEKFTTDGRKGGNHRLMKPEEASEFLKRFEDKAQSGQIITVKEISSELDQLTGKERNSQSTIYAFLHSNGWRMVMPRSKHPQKASDEEIASSKKLTLESKK